MSSKHVTAEWLVRTNLDSADHLIEYTFDLSTAIPEILPTGSIAQSDAVQGGRKRWLLRESPHRGRLAHAGLPAVVARVLENRGVSSPAEAQIFLGGKAVALCDSSTIPNFPAALRILATAIEERRLVCVYGDFDVDGITSTAILTETVGDLGGVVLPYIPNRATEGYGLNNAAIESLADRGVEVLVTCDCGTTSTAEIERARGLGLEVVVVDHHVPPAHLPDASALVNPKLRAADKSMPEYASGALAFRLAEALYDAARRPFPENRYLELAALATVADMVPLTGENRELLRRGLEALAKTERPGLRALMEVSGIAPKSVSAEAIGFGLAPRLNATGRLADARLALDLLLTKEEPVAAELAATIDSLNKERQRITREAEELARGIAAKQGDVPLTLLGHPDLHPGVVGLVASRLVELYARPAVVYQQGADESRASCRSIPQYDIVDGLRACGDLFERYGGHSQAGGFTIRNDRLEELQERLLEHAAGVLQGLELAPVLEIDAEWPLQDLRSQEIKWLNKLQPHGMANPDAVFLSRGLTVADASLVGEDKRHLKLKLRGGPVVWPAIAFRWDQDKPAIGQQIDAVFSISADRYGSSSAGGSLQLNVLDLAPTS